MEFQQQCFSNVKPNGNNGGNFDGSFGGLGTMNHHANGVLEPGTAAGFGLDEHSGNSNMRCFLQHHHHQQQQQTMHMIMNSNNTSNGSSNCNNAFMNNSHRAATNNPEFSVPACASLNGSPLGIDDVTPLACLPKHLQPRRGSLANDSLMASHRYHQQQMQLQFRQQQQQMQQQQQQQQQQHQQQQSGFNSFGNTDNRCNDNSAFANTPMSSQDANNPNFLITPKSVVMRRNSLLGANPSMVMSSNEHRRVQQWTQQSQEYLNSVRSNNHNESGIPPQFPQTVQYKAVPGSVLVSTNASTVSAGTNSTASSTPPASPHVIRHQSDRGPHGAAGTYARSAPTNPSGTVTTNPVTRTTSSQPHLVQQSQHSQSGTTTNANANANTNANTTTLTLTKSAAKTSARVKNDPMNISCHSVATSVSLGLNDEDLVPTNATSAHHNNNRNDNQDRKQNNYNEEKVGDSTNNNNNNSLSEFQGSGIFDQAADEVCTVASSMFTNSLASLTFSPKQSGNNSHSNTNNGMSTNHMSLGSISPMPFTTSCSNNSNNVRSKIDSDAALEYLMMTTQNSLVLDDGGDDLRPGSTNIRSDTKVTANKHMPSLTLSAEFDASHRTQNRTCIDSDPCAPAMSNLSADTSAKQQQQQQSFFGSQFTEGAGSEHTSAFSSSMMSNLLGSNLDFGSMPSQSSSQQQQQQQQNMFGHDVTNNDTILNNANRHDSAVGTSSTAATSRPPAQQRRRSSVGGTTRRQNHKDKALRPIRSVNEDIDVFLGRGGGSNNQNGNKRYQQVVQQYTDAYHNSTTNQEKTTVAVSIVNFIQSYGGRFVFYDKEEQCNFEITMDAAVKKVRQRLRENCYAKFGKEK